MDKAQLADDVFRQTAELLTNFRRKQMATDPVMKGEMFILSYIARKNAAVLPSELSAMMNCSSARVAMTLRSMEQKGYIRRDLDKFDRRKILVTMTKKGRELENKTTSEMRSVMETIVGELGEDDTREFIRIVGRINGIARVSLARKIEE